MLNTIKEAAENFCKHQIGQDHSVDERTTKKRTLIAYIDIEEHNGKRHRVYLAADEPFVQKVSQLFLEEQESDEETLKDMLLETANLIVGSAKVLAQESQTPYTIATPHFAKIGQFDYDVDYAQTITIDDAELTIAIKELDE